tara:strand:- start:789 stop:1169 length:381 start_codon:yes stop_codon:yes gene_type:complete
MNYTVKWKKHCTLCRNPLKIYIVFDNLDDYKYISNYLEIYTYLNFIDFSNNNIIRYKTFGSGKAHALCYSCFRNDKSIYSIVKNMHISGRIPRISGDRSLTRKEICEWFENMNKWAKRPDALDFII